MAGDRQRGPRPRPERQRLSWSCTLYWDGGSAEVSLRNISADGAMVATSAKLPKGTEIVLAFSAAGTAFGTVKWTRAGRLGMRFDRPFDPGPLLNPKQGSATGTPGTPRPGIVKPRYLESELEADSPWAARWAKLRPEDLE